MKAEYSIDEIRAFVKKGFRSVAARYAASAWLHYDELASKVLKTSDEWLKLYPVTIMDPDGWDRKNYEFSFYEERITKAEFDNRVGHSTCMLASVQNKKDYPRPDEDGAL